MQPLSTFSLTYLLRVMSHDLSEEKETPLKTVYRVIV